MQAINICLGFLFVFMWVEGGNWSAVDTCSGVHSYAWLRNGIWDECQEVWDAGFNIYGADFVIGG